MIDVKTVSLFSKSADHNYCLHYNLKNDDIYVEAGAYIGRFITKIIRKQQTEISHNTWDIEEPISIHLKKTILIEPCTWSADIIKQIIDNDIVENGILIKKAISSTSSEKEKKETNKRKRIKKFVNWKDNYSASRLAFHDNDFPEQAEEIELDTIDNLVSDLNLPRIDLLCGDIEGEEVNMIKGAEKSLEKGLIKNIAICSYHKEPDNHNDISNILKSYNYKDIKYDVGITFAKL